MSDGHISNVTRRGNISQRIQSMSSSGIRRFFDILESMENVISLGVGQPDFVTPAASATPPSIAREGHTHYTSNYGIIELRQAISRNLERLYGVYYEPATEIIVTSGVSEGQAIVMEALLDIGDEVLCPDPHYVAYPATVALADGVFVPVPTNQDERLQGRWPPIWRSG